MFLAARSRIFLSLKLVHICNYGNVKQPGIGKGLKIRDVEDKNYALDEDVNVECLHNGHISELQNTKEYQLKTVQRKYFKSAKEPALLTWEEREQIQYLYNSDPEEWNVEKLACSFPASRSTIKKVLKAQWKPSSAKKRLAYNQKIWTNWVLLKQSKLNLAPDLKVHIGQFASRRHNVTSTDGVPAVNSPEIQNWPSEFGNIIKYKSCNSRGADISGKREFDKLVPNQLNKETVISNNESHKDTNNGINSNHMKGEKGKKILAITGSSNNKIMESGRNCQTRTEDKSNSLQQIVQQYPEKIKIPHDKWIRGTIFKINDCYYDDDGEFLYRVPGMYY